MRHPLALACAVHAASSIAIGWLFAAHAGDEPYMDEIFHVRQAQRYCDGDLWAWDPKITTPPGLYLVGAPWALALDAARALVAPSAAAVAGAACSLGALRMLNGALALVCVLALAAIHRARGLPPAKAAAQALVLSL